MIIPDDHREYRLVSFDPGTQTTGVAIFDIRTEDDHILQIDAFTLYSKKLPDTHPYSEIHSARVHQLARYQTFILRLLQSHKPCVVAVEAPFYYRRCPGAFQPLLEVVTMIQQTVLMYAINCEMHSYEPLVVKRAVGATLSKDKSSVKSAILKIPSIADMVMQDIDDLDEHALDAIAVGYAYLTHRRHHE